MLFGFRRPTSPTWTISGTGAQFESDIRISDGNPGVLTTFRWLSAGSPAITDYVALRADWTTPVVCRGAAMLGLRLETDDFPAGCKVEIRGKRSGDSGYPYELGGNALTEVTREKADGSIHICWAFADGLDPLVGYEVRIFNDVAASTWATADTYVQVGEADIFQMADLCVAVGWRSSLEVATESSRTLDAQLHEVERTNYRAVEFGFPPTAGDDVRRQGLPNGVDWDQIEAIVARSGARVLCYVQTTDADGVTDYDYLHSTAIFGKARPAQVVHVAREFYTGGYRVDEVPAVV